MAIELLVKAADNVVPDSPAPHMLWKQGMIVVIKQSPYEWGSAEAPPLFWRITIEGIDLTDPLVEEWLAQNWDETDPDNPVPLSQRKLYLDINQLPVPIRNDIVDDGYATVTSNRLQGFRDALVIVT